MYGRGDGIIRWWMDGVLVGDYTNVKFPNDNGFVEYQISPTWGGNTGDVKTENRLLLVRPQLSEQEIGGALQRFLLPASADWSHPR